jgi:hypothetical protein
MPVAAEHDVDRAVEANLKATTVEYRLDRSGDSTHVSFTYIGFESGEPWDSARARFGPGWHAFLESLKRWVERPRAEPSAGDPRGLTRPAEQGPGSG